VYPRRSAIRNVLMPPDGATFVPVAAGDFPTLIAFPLPSGPLWGPNRGSARVD
jgi:hypothetical protein